MAANYDLQILQVQGIGPGGGRRCYALMGDALFRELCTYGGSGIVSGLLGELFPLLGISALPAHATLDDTTGPGCAVGSDYGDLSVYDDSESRYVVLSDPAGTDGNPAPSFEAFCTGLGGAYTHEAS